MGSGDGAGTYLGPDLTFDVDLARVGWPSDSVPHRGDMLYDTEVRSSVLSHGMVFDCSGSVHVHRTWHPNWYGQFVGMARQAPCDGLCCCVCKLYMCDPCGCCACFHISAHTLGTPVHAMQALTRLCAVPQPTPVLLDRSLDVSCVLPCPHRWWTVAPHEVMMALGWCMIGALGRPHRAITASHPATCCSGARATRCRMTTLGSGARWALLLSSSREWLALVKSLASVSALRGFCWGGRDGCLVPCTCPAAHACLRPARACTLGCSVSHVAKA